MRAPAGENATQLTPVECPGSMLDSSPCNHGLGFRVQRFRGGLVFKAHILFVSLNSRLESNQEDEKLRVDGEAVERLHTPRV